MYFTNLTTEYLPKWDQFVSETPNSTFYHQSEWFHILEDVFRYKQRGFIQLIDGKIVGGLPLFRVNRFIGNAIVSSPFRDRGGVLCLPGINPGCLLEQAMKYDDFHTNYILIKQMNEFDGNVSMDFPVVKSTNFITTQVDLRNGSKAIWKKLDNNAQGPVKQALKKGVEIVIGDKPADMISFYKIFRKNRKLLGIPSFSVTFFLKLWDTLNASGKMCLMLAKLGEKTLAGLILLLHKNIVIDGYAASIHEHRHYRANDLLVWSAIEWACKREYGAFDFGADSKLQKNLLSFKKKWGGKQSPVYHYYLIKKTHRLPNDDSSSPKYIFFRKVLSMLPTPVFSLISNHTVSRFG
jgi:hypothetical protein